ncbi:DUF2199 domain-containing protein [Isoptericola sp. AK164]|uniref:DUF2199 domain-containing protein n=1 Tax=Isoptericola sp. AK164 TaxID=3024246 RepID=UPI00241853FC|nr:DUF2199 domain-containing protein [Isoptericola sp. AK164]
MIRCATCGRPAETHDRHVRFRLPEPVLRTERQHQAEGVWTTDPDPTQAVMMQVPDVGPFVRALPPIRLDGGHTFTYGVWVGVHPDDLQTAFRTWWAPEYVDLRLSGYLANIIEPWDVLAAPVDLVMRHPDHTPYCVASDSEELHDILTREWDHGLVLSAVCQSSRCGGPGSENRSRPVRRVRGSDPP